MSEAMIVAPQPEAVEAGAVALRQDGNAVDAAITCALVQGVVDPMMCGIAGFGNMQIYMPGAGEHLCIDFHGNAPAATRDDMWADMIEGETRDGFGFILKDRVNDLGYQSITVPGSLKAYYQSHQRFGSLPWREIVAPAIAQAEDGFLVRPHVAYWWSLTDQLGRVDNGERLSFTESGRRLYCTPDGAPKPAGAFIRNPDLAETLRRIAEHGADDFYQGEIAERIAADMAAHGGLLSLDDLNSYQTVETAPLEGRYRGLRLATNHPPGGGIMLVEMLNILENFDLRALGHNSANYLQVVAEVMKHATVDKDTHVGDPAFFDVPVERLTDPGYAAGLADAIKSGARATVARFGADEPRDTTHVAVVDAAGNAVSMTHSLGMPSGVITDGLGFMYNGCMGVFDPRPGRADSLAPGKSRFSSLCPTILFKDGAPHLVIGAPGGTQIAMGVLQAILNVVDFDMSITDAIIAPRFSATSNAIDVMNRIPRYVTDALEDQGYEVIRSHLSYGIAAVHGIRVDQGRCTGAADPGHDGMALGV